MHPVVIDVAGPSTRKALVGAGVALALGVLGLVGFASTGGLALLVIGGGLVALGLLPLLAWKKLSRPRALVVEAQGVRWDDPQGKPWAVAWGELGAVSVSRSVDGGMARRSVPRTFLRLDLFPGDPGFAARHPEMAHLLRREDGRYRLPVADSFAALPVLDGALRQAAGPRYRGVVDEQITIGLT
ncbi:hypothetical protein LV78_007335 [Actinosynnema pretiosum]|uniref:hypothetical protein n=1 Tax=Actinosynnema pretiosum TaxID=42197 RepID=UPI0020A475B8|nr:hypothetical protein [Actinosynnema pretiosum]MCP2099333.1 hypothetical protein [Actinosynnema pretiosum]